jgi:PAS domain S-box-containing protein
MAIGARSDSTIVLPITVYEKRKPDMDVKRIVREWSLVLMPIALVAASALVRSILVPVLTFAPYIAFFPSITISALYGGFWPGMFAILLSVLAVGNGFTTGVSALFEIPGGLAGMIAFLLSSTIIVVICSRLLTIRQRITAEAQKLRESEKALKASEERLKRSQEIAHLGSWELDLEKNILTWSDEVYRIFGMQPQEFSATYESFLEAVHPDDREAVDQAYAGSVNEARDSYEIEHRVVRKSTGEIRHVHEKCRHFRDETGRIIRSVGMVHDITERKRSERERELLLAEVQRSNAELEQFAYVASHDLQEPLRMVGSYTTLLEKKYKEHLDERAHEYIHFAVDGAERMQKLIEGLLAYSRITRRGEEFKQVDLNGVFSLAVSNLSVIIQETRAEVTKDDLPMISGDEIQLVQLLQNLIGNGIKYRKLDVRPRVHLSGKKDGRYNVLSVRDNGIGIETKYYERIFQIFQRLHSRSKYSGTGIGLALCRRIVERHHGRIWVESVPGEGSTFFFTVPV